jgi:hypothetical protein
VRLLIPIDINFYFGMAFLLFKGCIRCHHVFGNGNLPLSVTDHMKLNLCTFLIGQLLARGPQPQPILNPCLCPATGHWLVVHTGYFPSLHLHTPFSPPLFHFRLLSVTDISNHTHQQLKRNPSQGVAHCIVNARGCVY